MTCKDPLTNQVIVGEVEFFELELDQIWSVMGHEPKPAEEPETALSGGTPAMLVHKDSLMLPTKSLKDCETTENAKKEFKAIYIGSDFNYATDKNFRMKFR